MRRKGVTRRALAQAAMGAAVLAGATELVRDSNHAFTDVLAQFRSHVLGAFRASDVEALAKAAHELVAEADIATVPAALAAITGQEVAMLASLNARELRSIIGRRIRADFERDEVVDVCGWQLSRTEVLIVAMTVRRPMDGVRS